MVLRINGKVAPMDGAGLMKEQVDEGSKSILISAYQIPIGGSNQQPVGLANCCIYCRTVTELLTDEHIIADGMGGNIYLPKSSCLSCNKITSEVERRLLKSSISDMRGALGIRSRKGRKKKKDPPRQMFLKTASHGIDGAIYREYTSESPWILVQDATGMEPGIMLGREESSSPQLYVQAISQVDASDRLLAALAGSQGGMAGSAVGGDWLYVAAKSAHAFAVASLGQGAFYEFLPNYILRKSEGSGTHWVGSGRTPYEVTDTLHWIRLFDCPLFDKNTQSLDRVYVVQLRLFANVPSHVYTIAVGRKYRPLEYVNPESGFVSTA